MVQELIEHDVSVLNGKAQQCAFFVIRLRAARPHSLDQPILMHAGDARYASNKSHANSIGTGAELEELRLPQLGKHLGASSRSASAWRFACSAVSRSFCAMLTRRSCHTQPPTSSAISASRMIKRVTISSRPGSAGRAACA